MEFSKQEKYYLSKCFICSEFRSVAIDLIGTQLAEIEIKEIDLIPDSLMKFIDVKSLKNKIIESVFNEKFILSNINNVLIKSFFIEKLSDYSNFSLKYCKTPGFVNGGYHIHYCNERQYHGDVKYYRNGLKSIAEMCVYNPDYAEAKKELKNIKVQVDGGGSGADYIENSFFAFQNIGLSIVAKLSDYHYS